MFSTPKTGAGYTFGTPTTTTATGNAPGGFQFGAGDNKVGAAVQPTKPNFGFGPTSTPLGSTVSSTMPLSTGAPTGLNFSCPPATNVQGVSPQLSFGTPTSKPITAAAAGIFTPAKCPIPYTPSTYGFAAGKCSVITPSTAAISTTQTTLAVGGFASAATPKTTAVSSATVAATFAFIQPTSTSTTTTATAIPSFNLTASTAAGFTLGTPSSTTTTATGILPAVTTASTLTALMTASATDSAIPSTGNLTFSQLEDAINKWTIDLEEQGKLFGNQAKQLNAWDRLLISNSEKILSLNNGIERVKQQQQQLDQELDFVLAQQKELEDLIVPLEKELNDLPATDLDRNQTYQMAENLDSQLKQMSEDLKEVVEHLNESNKNQELSNPITQIGKILNAHMNSLQWIDRNTSKISSHLDQISKMHDMNRRNHEMSLQKTYD